MTAREVLRSDSELPLHESILLLDAPTWKVAKAQYMCTQDIVLGSSVTGLSSENKYIRATKSADQDRRANDMYTNYGIFPLI